MWIEEILSYLWDEIAKNPDIPDMLILDVGFLLIILIDKILVKRFTQKLRIPAVIVSVHLVMGSLALWFYTHSAYNIITAICWGALLFIFLVKPGEESLEETQKRTEALKEENMKTAVAEGQEAAPRLQTTDEV